MCPSARVRRLNGVGAVAAVRGRADARCCPAFFHVSEDCPIGLGWNTSMNIR